jgi:DeoR/GlpR family transcriptional regulator of sugar metabolism
MSQSLDTSDIDMVAARIKRMIEDGNPSIITDVTTLLHLIDELKEKNALYN